MTTSDNDMVQGLEDVYEAAYDVGSWLAGTEVTNEDVTGFLNTVACGWQRAKQDDEPWQRAKQDDEPWHAQMLVGLLNGFAATWAMYQGFTMGKL